MSQPTPSAPPSGSEHQRPPPGRKIAQPKRPWNFGMSNQRPSLQSGQPNKPTVPSQRTDSTQLEPSSMSSGPGQQQQPSALSQTPAPTMSTQQQQQPSALGLSSGLSVPGQQQPPSVPAQSSTSVPSQEEHKGPFDKFLRSLGTNEELTPSLFGQKPSPSVSGQQQSPSPFRFTPGPSRPGQPLFSSTSLKHTSAPLPATSSPIVQSIAAAEVRPEINAESPHSSGPAPSLNTAAPDIKGGSIHTSDIHHHCVSSDVAPRLRTLMLGLHTQASLCDKGSQRHLLTGYWNAFKDIRFILDRLVVTAEDKWNHCEKNVVDLERLMAALDLHPDLSDTPRVEKVNAFRTQLKEIKEVCVALKDVQQYWDTLSETFPKLGKLFPTPAKQFPMGDRDALFETIKGLSRDYQAALSEKTKKEKEIEELVQDRKKAISEQSKQEKNIKKLETKLEKVQSENESLIRQRQDDPKLKRAEEVEKELRNIQNDYKALDLEYKREKAKVLARDSTISTRDLCITTLKEKVATLQGKIRELEDSADSYDGGSDTYSIVDQLEVQLRQEAESKARKLEDEVRRLKEDVKKLNANLDQWKASHAGRTHSRTQPVKAVGPSYDELLELEWDLKKKIHQAEQSIIFAEHEIRSVVNPEDEDENGVDGIHNGDTDDDGDDNDDNDGGNDQHGDNDADADNVDTEGKFGDDEYDSTDGASNSHAGSQPGPQEQATTFRPMQQKRGNESSDGGREAEDFPTLAKKKMKIGVSSQMPQSFPGNTYAAAAIKGRAKKHPVLRIVPNKKQAMPQPPSSNFDFPDFPTPRGIEAPQNGRPASHFKEQCHREMNKHNAKNRR